VVAARARDAALLATGPPVATGSAMLAFHEVPVGEGYAAIAGDDDATPNVIVDTEEAAVRELLEPLPPGRALHAACGTGRHATCLAGRGQRVAGVDRSAAMLSVAAAKLADEPLASLALGEAAVAWQRWAAPVPEAARQALVGLPMVLVWELEWETAVLLPTRRRGGSARPAHG
jgi:SAM-dependent methyltransferase